MLNKLTIKKDTIKTLILVIIYKVILDLAYYLIISPIWTYSKFIFKFNGLKFIESYFLLFIVFFLTPKKTKKLSNIMLWVLFLMSYIPTLTLFALMDESRIFMYATALFWAIISLMLRTKIPKLNFKKLKQAKIIRWIIFIAVPIMSFVLIYKYLGLNLNFSFRNIYEIRSYYTGLHIPFAGYILNWSAKIIGPLLFIIFFMKKKWIPLILVIALQILLFSVTGHKGYLFAIPFVVAMLWVINKKNPLKWITIGLIVIILISSLSYYLIDDSWLSSLATRRNLLIPAQLSFFYYNFFSNHQFTFLSQHHIFKNLINYPYHFNPPCLIGKTYFNNPQNSANNGIVSDGYMNFGFMGMFMWAIVLSFILKLIDNFSIGKNIKMTFAIIAITTLSIRSSSLLTVLVTHGLLFSLLLLYLLPKENLNKKI